MTSSGLGECYDRVIYTAAALSLLRIGVPHTRIHSMLSVIQQMVHRVRTVYGNKDQIYGGDTHDDWDNYPQDIL